MSRIKRVIPKTPYDDVYLIHNRLLAKKLIELQEQILIILDGIDSGDVPATFTVEEKIAIKAAVKEVNDAISEMALYFGDRRDLSAIADLLHQINYFTTPGGSQDKAYNSNVSDCITPGIYFRTKLNGNDIVAGGDGMSSISPNTKIQTLESTNVPTLWSVATYDTENKLYFIRQTIFCNSGRFYTRILQGNSLTPSAMTYENWWCVRNITKTDTIAQGSTALIESGAVWTAFNNLVIPTKTSQLDNDAGFITASAIPTVPTNVSQLVNDSGYITYADGCANFSKVLSISSQILTADTTNNILCNINTYYRISTVVAGDTELVITLPGDIDSDNIEGLVVSFTTGSNPSVNFVCEDTDIPVDEFKGLEIAADSKYELNFIFNGVRWIVAYGEIETNS